MNRSRAYALYISVAACLCMWPAPASGQTEAAFRLPPSRELVVPEFTDNEVIKLMAALDSALAPEETVLSPDDVGYTLWSFVRRLQAGRLTTTQEASVLHHLDALGRTNAGWQGPLDHARTMVKTLTVGKTAPDAIGRDLAGNPLSLADYRGKVVLLAFSADWCGICRSQYPYYKLMQEMYAVWPFAILGVETGDLEAAARVKAQHGLTYRSWWDAPAGNHGRGPIASSWNVRGWPTTYLLDAHGVIRFANLRDEELLKAARQLLTEHAEAQSDGGPRAR
jgi:peroxiredoxin